MSSKRESTCQRASNGVKPEDGTAYADGLAYPKFEADTAIIPTWKGR